MYPHFPKVNYQGLERGRGKLKSTMETGSEELYEAQVGESRGRTWDHFQSLSIHKYLSVEVLSAAGVSAFPFSAASPSQTTSVTEINGDSDHVLVHI